MCPGRPPARRSTSSAPARRRSSRAEQQRRVQVALDAAVVADGGPALVERLPPVEADDVAAGLADLAQDGGGVDAEMDDRHAGVFQRVEDRSRVGQRELAVVVAPERPGPRVEDLQRLHARLDLRRR
jgi:hypothetical protein